MEKEYIETEGEQKLLRGLMKNDADMIKQKRAMALESESKNNNKE